MKKIAFSILFLFTVVVGFSQTNKVVACSSYTLTINKDSLNKGQTTFSKVNLSFLSGSTNNESYLKSGIYNKTSFILPSLIIDTTQRKKTMPFKG